MAALAYALSGRSKHKAFPLIAGFEQLCTRASEHWVLGVLTHGNTSKSLLHSYLFVCIKFYKMYLKFRVKLFERFAHVHT